MHIDKESKFDNEQKVFCIEKYNDKPTCTLCNGEKKVIIKTSQKEFETDCPICDGTGKCENEYEVILWKLKVNNPWNIDGIFMTIWKDGKTEFSYGIDYKYPDHGGCSMSIDESDCFPSMKEALEEIQKRNAKKEIEYED